MTKIVEKYFEKNDFAKRASGILSKVCDDTGFVVEKEIFRGMIYDEDKLGSVIYKGKYKNKDAVLKLQGLRPDPDEIDIIVNFVLQNKSTKIRLPKLYEKKYWNEEDGYGYLITEFISSPHIFEMPYANKHQIERFCEFYQEYRTNCLNQPFIPASQNEESTSDFILRRAAMWSRIAISKGNLTKRISKANVDAMLKNYNELIKKELQNVKMVFCHGHLTANDIFDKGDEFILLSNLYWSFRPELYDLVFGLHWCIENIKDSNFSYAKYVEFVKSWLDCFYEIPIIKKDPNAKSKIHLMLLERTLGGILLDTGSRPLEDKSAKRLFKLQLKFFEELSTRIVVEEFF